MARKLFPAGVIITVGRGFEDLSGADQHFDQSAEALETVTSLCSPETYILVKGSRGTALEKAIPQEAV